MMRRCAFLTMTDIGDFVTYDHLLIEPMSAAGWQVEMVPWQAKVDWDDFELAIIRTPWDYHDHQQAFLEVLAAIEQSQCRLENPLDIVRWNIDKVYLKQLQQRGCPIVPTRFKSQLTNSDVLDAYAEFGTDKLVIKPTISASAMDTFPVGQQTWVDQQQQILPIFQDKVAMLQPFIPAVVSEGEFSLFYFAGQLSHSILKTPKADDFRVQEEYGARLQLIQPPVEILKAGQQAIDAVGQELLYARVDLVRMSDGQFALMELELIEPSLYFNMDSGSAQRFVDRLQQWL